MTVFSVWLGVSLHSAKVQKDSVAAITAPDPRGQYIGYDYQYLEDGGMNPTIGPDMPSGLVQTLGEDFFYRVVYVNLNGAAASAVRLTNLRDLPHLRYLGLDNGVVTTEVADAIGGMRHLETLSLQMCHISDEQLRRFKHLQNLHTLSLSFNTIGDAGLESVSNLQGLRVLKLQDTGITDEGLRHLSGLTNLEALYLSGNERITNAGLAHLRPLVKLRKLSLWNDRKISDDGLAALRELPKLKELDVSTTAVSKKGAAELEAAVPGLKVSR